jgi:hypothetical protein
MTTDTSLIGAKMGMVFLEIFEKYEVNYTFGKRKLRGVIILSIYFKLAKYKLAKTI